jgi:hypothetical protein
MAIAVAGNKSAQRGFNCPFCAHRIILTSGQFRCV